MESPWMRLLFPTKKLSFPSGMRRCMNAIYKEMQFNYNSSSWPLSGCFYYHPHFLSTNAWNCARPVNQSHLAIIALYKVQPYLSKLQPCKPNCKSTPPGNTTYFVFQNVDINFHSTFASYPARLLNFFFFGQKTFTKVQWVRALW